MTRQGVVISIALIGFGLLGFVNLAQFHFHDPSPFLVVKQESGTVSVHITMEGQGTSPIGLHYAEHLAWLNAVGAERPADRHSNAWTSDTAVGYWLSGAPEDLSDLLETLKGVFAPIDLPPDFTGLGQ